MDGDAQAEDVGVEEGWGRYGDMALFLSVFA